MPFTVRSSARARSGSGSRPASRVRAPALRQGDLQVVQRGEVVVPHAQRPLQHGVGVEQLGLAAQPEQFLEREVVLGSDRLERLAQLVRHEPLHVVAGDVEVGLDQRHRHVRQEVAEEVPALVHLGEPVAEAGLPRGGETAAPRRTSPARSGATGSSRTPTESRGGSPGRRPSPGRLDGREPRCSSASSSTGVEAK